MSPSEERHFLAFENPPDEHFKKRLETRIDTVEAAMLDVFEYAERRAQRLSDTYGHNSEYFLALMFDRGSFIHPMSKHSMYGPSESPNKTGQDTASNFVQLQREFYEEFDSLASEHRLALSNFLEKNDPQFSLAIRTAPSDRAADVQVTFDTIKCLFLLLKCRCGVDGFFCLAKGNNTHDICPSLFFSDPEIRAHLVNPIGVRDANIVGYQIEKFGVSIAPRIYAAWMRGEIKVQVDMLFAQVTGRKDITMDYDNYEKAVLIDLGITIVGWTHPTFARPSELPLEVQPLETLLRALNTGACYFRRIAEAECNLHIFAYMQRMNLKSKSLPRARARYPSGISTASREK